MNKPPQNSAQMPDYLKARKLHLNGIIVGMAGMKVCVRPTPLPVPGAKGDGVHLI